MHFPASIWKSRSFGLGLGLQIAFIVLVGLVNSTPAAAQLTVCNHTKAAIMAAYSKTVTGDDRTTTSGFYSISAGVCSLIDPDPLTFWNTYLYAWDPNNPKVNWSGPDDSIFQHCVPNNHKAPPFEYHDQEKYNPPCGAGQIRLSFMMATVGSMAQFTANITDPNGYAGPAQSPSPAAAPAPNPAPHPAPPTPASRPASSPASGPAPTPASTLGRATAGIPKPGKAVLSTTSAPTGNAVLLVTSGLAAQPGAQNPLAGHTFVLMNQSYEAALAGAGIQAPAGVSPVKGFLAACTNHQPACQPGVAATNSSTVSGARADAAGKAQLPGVPPGTYYFFCLGGYDNQLFKWDFAIQLKPGTNSVTLDQHNAVLVN
jgi:uncharacterized membrane protein